MQKDYVGWGLAVIGIILSLIFGIQNRQLEDNRQQIYNSAQIIQQYITNNNYTLPEAIQEQIESIVVASGPTVTIKYK